MKLLLQLVLSLGLFSLVFWQSSYAQTAQYTVRGKVTDSKDQSAAIGVTVAELDPDARIVRGVMTDVEGNFVIKVTNPKHRLSFSSIGYKTLIEPINLRTSINVTIVSNEQELSEVVVTSRRADNGLLSVSERNLTTAIARIDAKQLEEMQASSIDQALQGRMSGVDITAASGDPGAGMQIRIRGTSSINSSADPMIVVDGMPYETQIPSDFNFGTADELGYAQLLNIAPSDIKDISILKDAAATAVWGARAANGVVVINTKRGAVGKPRISYTFKGSLAKQPNSIPMLSGDQYSMLIPEEFMNRTGTPLNTQQVKEFQYDPNDPYWYYNYTKNTNWVDEITRLGNSHDHNISLNGGGEKAKYYASIGYFGQQGTTIGTGLKRISTRINLDYNVSDRIRFRTDLAFANTTTDRNYVNSSSSQDGIRNIAYIKMPNMAVYEYDEYGNQTPNFFSPASNIQGLYPGVYNPVAMALAARNNILNKRVTPHFKLEYDLKPEILSASFDVQFDINNTKNQTFLPQIATGRPWTETSVNRAYDGDIDQFNVSTKTVLMFTPKIKNTKHNVISLLSLMTSDTRNVSQEVLASNTASSEFQDPSNPSRTQNQELRLVAGSSQTRSVGLLADAQYEFDDRYFIRAGIRGDGNSRFGPAHRYGLFPSISTRWRLSGERFMKPLEVIFDDISLRASYGQSGNAPKYDYTFYSTYGTFAWSYLGMGGVYPSNMELKNLRWETIIGRNIGVNLSMFKKKITLDLEFYKNRTKNLFFNGLQIASFTGFESVNMNVGTMDNQGWEATLNTTLSKTKDLIVDFNFNIARNINVIREISDLYPRERGKVTANGQYKTYVQINNPFGSFYGFKYQGVYSDASATVAKGKNGEAITTPTGEPIYMRFNYPQTDYLFQPGDAKYADINNDGNINYMDIVYLGNSNPAFTGGFGPSLTWKGRLKLTAFFNFRYDYDIVNGTKMMTTNMYGYDNQSTIVLSRWRKPGDVTDVPRALYQSGYNWLGSDRYVEDASFLRFRTLTLRYTFSKRVLSKLGLQNLSGYITGENLFTWTNYSGQDPEVSMRGSDPFRVAADYSMTPPSKMITLGFTTSF